MLLVNSIIFAEVSYYYYLSFGLFMTNPLILDKIERMIRNHVFHFDAIENNTVKILKSYASSLQFLALANTKTIKAII